MSKFTDEWGDEAEKFELTDWENFEPWQFWKNGFVWVRCDTEIEEQDVIAFRDDVAIEYPDGSKRYIKGTRFIIGRIAGITEDNVYIEVIHSEGQEAYLPEEKIYRTARWLCRYGVYRWPRCISPTEGLTEDQIKQHDADKERRQKENKPLTNNDHKRFEGDAKKDFLALHEKFSSDFLKAARKKIKNTDKLKLDM
jgi:hypothetical protein